MVCCGLGSPTSGGAESKKKLAKNHQRKQLNKRDKVGPGLP